MFKSILVPIDLTNTDLAKPAVATAVSLSQASHGTIRLLNVLHMTPVMLTEYVPADFDMLQRQSSQEALAIVAREVGIEPSRISSVVRQGSSVYHEILEESQAVDADLIVIGRSGTRGAELLSRLSETLRQAPCPVLIVHPSGRAAATGPTAWAT